MKKIIKENIKSFAIAVVLAVLFRSFLYEPYMIPSASMYPTLQIKDYLFISKFEYGYSKYSMFGVLPIENRLFFAQPKRGDIIVFKHTKDDSVNYVKRLIGLPGDSVQLINGILYINDVAVHRSKKGAWKVEDNPKLSYTRYEERLDNGVSYDVLEIEERKYGQFMRNTPKYIVPQGYYFFMGDNRDNSVDSRFQDLGFVPERNLLGKVKVLFWTKDFSILNLVTKLDTGRTFLTF